MAKSAPPLLALLRSRLQGELLAHVYLRSRDGHVSISDLARELHAPVSTVFNEVTRLVDAGLLAEQKVGRMRIISTPADALLTKPLTELLALSFGPLPVLTDLFRGIPDVDAAYIHGSWAARYAGEPGPVPNDVDVLVVGQASPEHLDEIAHQAERRLRRPVDVRQVSPRRWRSPGGDPFLRTVRQRPLVSLLGETTSPVIVGGVDEDLDREVDSGTASHRGDARGP